MKGFSDDIRTQFGLDITLDIVTEITEIEHNKTLKYLGINIINSTINKYYI